MKIDQSETRAAMVVLCGSRLDELELLSGGLLAPADGYCLPSQVPGSWPVPFHLAVPYQLGISAVERGYLLLADPDNTPLARLRVSGSQISADKSSVYLAGNLTRLRSADHPPARHLRVTAPLPLLSTSPVDITAAVFSKTPLPWQLASAMVTALETNSVLWLVALCGPQPHGRYTVQGLLYELESAASQIEGARTGLVVLPVAPGSTSKSDHALQDHVLGRLGAGQLLDYAAEVTQNEQPPAEVVPAHRAGTVIFLTGLSGSGKSTVARALAESIQRDEQVPVTLLDGDDVRRILSPGLGFSKSEREANIQRIGWVASLVSGSGGTAICAPIAPFDESRKHVRRLAEGMGGFLLVHISTPLPVCEARDRKGLYAKARRGEVTDFTGIDSPYEYPHDADLHLDTSKLSIDEAVVRIREALNDVDSSVRSVS